MLAIDVSGTLDDVCTAQFAKEVLVARSHTEGREDTFVARVPGTEGSNGKAKARTFFAL